MLASPKTVPQNPCGFNPATAGYAAKVWECLRRNPEFREDVRLEIEDRRHGRQRDPDRPRFTRGRNPCAAYVGTQLMRGGIRAHLGEEIQPFDLDTDWSELPEAFRDEVEWFLRCERPRAINFEAGYSRDLQLAGFEYYASEGTLIRIPKVRDSDHRKEVVAAIMKLIPDAPKSGKKYRPSGSVFGSKQDWDAFLVYRYYVPILGELRAKWMASWYCSPGSEFLSLTEAERVSGPSLETARGLHVSWTTHTTRRIGRIEAARAGVYPAFQSGFGR